MFVYNKKRVRVIFVNQMPPVIKIAIFRVLLFLGVECNNHDIPIF